jgi:hypothetical protein
MTFFEVKVADFEVKMAKCKKSAEIMARAYWESWVEFWKKNMAS